MRILGIIFFFLLAVNVFAQNQDRIFVPAQLKVVEMKYFFVKEFFTDDIKFQKFDPTDKIIEEYMKRNLICLNNIAKENWPKEVVQNPEKVLYVQCQVKKNPILFKCANVVFSEHDNKDNILFFTNFEPNGLYKEDKGACHKRIRSKISKGIASARERALNNDNKYSVMLKEGGYSYRSSYTPPPPPPIVQTEITKEYMSEYLLLNKVDSIEGIYLPNNLIHVSLYTLAIIKSDSCYDIICIDSNQKNWVEGGLKGQIPLDWSQGNNKITWYMSHRVKECARIILDKSGLLEFTYETVPEIIRKFKKVTTY